MDNVMVVFGTTGGPKILRAVRSFRKQEPNIPVHVVIDSTSNTWKSGGYEVYDELILTAQFLRVIENDKHINGTLNAAMRWVEEEDRPYACLFHDDVIFSPFAEHRGNLAGWFDRLKSDSQLMNSCALTLSLMEVGITGPDGDLFTGNAAPWEWDTMNLESLDLWSKLLPEAKVPGGFLEGKIGHHVYEVPGPPFAVRYYYGDVSPYTRLGPTGQIVPVGVWKDIGGFDEKEGIHYDAYYPAECAVRGFPPVRVISNIPHLHLHNQSIGFLDPSVGLWGNVSAAFERKYGPNFWKNRGVE